jgi:type IV pilus assembly protein PilA
MKGFFKTPATRVARGQGGFTLIEMIVVVGIIAVLAAVIIPNIGRFIGSGEKGAMTAEKESVQTAMNAMMAEYSVTSGLALLEDATNDWTENPTAGGSVVLFGSIDGEDPEPRYLQQGETIYYYCYDGTGQITKQFKESDETMTCAD